MQFKHYRFKPKFIPTLITLALLPFLVSLGLWQAGKAEQKKALQDKYDARSSMPPSRVSTDIRDVEAMLYRKIIVEGQFDPTYQILLDNRVHNEAAGYQVVTPFKLASSDVHVLINRGWVPLGSDRNVLPVIPTPNSQLEISGVITLPPSKIYELKPPEPMQGKWQVVWQNLDMKRYVDATSMKLWPVILQMDNNSPAGYVREWPRPDSRILTHLGYAFQWFGIAVVLVIFYIVANIEKITNPENVQDERAS